MIPQRVSGLNGALPTTYDPAWQGYTDLTPAQIAAFQAFPQDLVKYAGARRWQKENCFVVAGITYLSQNYITVDGIQVVAPAQNAGLLLGLAYWAQRNPGKTTSFTNNGTAVTITTDQALSICDGVTAYVQACRSAEALLLGEINATPPAVTSRAQIDAEFAAISQGS